MGDTQNTNMKIEKNPQKPSSFAEIHRLLHDLPGPDEEAVKQAAVHEAQRIKPAGSLGMLEQLVGWLAGWQGRYPPQLTHPRIAIFAGNHGVAAQDVSAYPASVTAQMVQSIIAGHAAINQICAEMDADLRVYELALETPTRDFTQGPAMTEEECLQAMSYGMMVVEPGLDVLCLGELGIGNTTSAAALSGALFGGLPIDWTGAGTGVTGEMFVRKQEIVAQGITLHLEAAKNDPFQLLARLGGFELAAICGAVLAARLARIPVLLDGFVCTSAAMPIFAALPAGLDHCRVGQISAEPGHKMLLSLLGTPPILDLGIRLGEAAGAALALAPLRAALACHKGMASFAEAGVSGPSDKEMNR